MGGAPKLRNAWPSGARTTGVCARPADARGSTRWLAEDSMRTIEVIPAEGILLIGDPHVSSRRPGRRRDDDFVATVIGKLSAAMSVADAGRLVPVILGDLLDAGDDSDIRMLTLITRVLRSGWCTPWYLVGNHTLTLGRRSTHRELSDGH